MPSLQPVDYDPFASGSKPRQNAASPYESDSDFRSEMDRIYGAGRWRETSGYRTRQQEDDLRHRGAGTVRPGDVSAHSRGVPGAPGARDIVVQGLDPAAAGKKLPATYQYLAEGREGPEGPHLHIDSPRLTPVDHDPFAGAPATKAPIFVPVDKDPFAPSKTARPTPDPKPRQPSAAPPADRVDPVSATGRRLQERLTSIEAQSQDPAHRIAAAISPFGAAASGVMDVVGLLTAPIGGLVESGASYLPENVPSEVAKHDPKVAAIQARQRQVANPQAERRALGDVAEAFTPIPVAGEAGAVARGAEEAGGAVARAGGRLAEHVRLTPVEHDPFKGTLAAGREDAAPAEISKPEAEGSHAAAGPVVGSEKDPATRTANALYRLGGSRTADMIEAKKVRESAPPEIRKLDEEAYHAREAKLVDPNAETPEHLKPVEDFIRPYHEEETDLINRIKARNNPDAEEYLTDSGYVHRIKAGGQGDPAALEGKRDPFLGRKTLSKTTGSMKGRKFLALVGEDGKPVLNDDGSVHVYTANDDPEDPIQAGRTIRGSFDKPMTFRQATTKEIEAGGIKDSKTGAPLRYHKSLIDNTVDNVMRLRRVERNLDVMDDTLQHMKERGVAHQEEWRYKDADGAWQTGRNKLATPAGFHTIHDNPYLKGWKFDINDAQVQELKDWLPKVNEDWLDNFDRINNFVLRSNFLNPFIHPKNIAEFWGVSRGGDWLMPQGYVRLASTMPRAVTEVLTMGPAYRRLLREGSALMSGEQRAPELTQLLTDKGAKELFDDPQSAKEIMKWAPFKTIGEAYTKVQQASHKAMWMLSDMMMMQRVLENEAKGLTSREAIRKAEEVIPNYRVPAQIWRGQGGRMASRLFANNWVFALGRYHYNKLAAWGRMFRKIAKGSPEERKEAFGQFVVASIMGGAIIPAIDLALKKLTGNQQTRVHRGGILSVPDAIGRVASGQEGLAQALTQVIDLSPASETAVEALRQRDYMNRPIVEPASSPGQQALQAGEWLGGKFGPAQMGLEALSPKYGAGRMALREGAGIDQPSAGAKGKSLRYLKGEAKRRERDDPLSGLAP